MFESFKGARNFLWTFCLASLSNPTENIPPRDFNSLQDRVIEARQSQFPRLSAEFTTGQPN